MNVMAPRPSPEHLSGAAIRGAFSLFEQWGLSEDQKRILLGQPSDDIFEQWRSGLAVTLPRDTMFRIGCLLGIHKALRYMFSEPQQRHGWVKRPSRDFGGRSALDIMLERAPTDIARIRAYLDAERAAW